MLYGVDVHTRYQAGISFATLAREDYSFAATKASQGNHLTFPDFPLWIERTRNAGLVPGAYHWIDNSAPGAEQARFFLKALAPVGGPEGLVIQLDCEDNATWQQVKDWAAEWEQKTGAHPWLTYTGGWWWRPRGWDGASLTPLLWDSRYLAADLDTVPDDPAAFAARIPRQWWLLPNQWPNPTSYGYGGWKEATFLQFTSKGDAGGLGNNVDLNATKLSMDQLLALTTNRGDDMPLTDEDAKKVAGAVWAQYLGNSGPTAAVAQQDTYKMVKAGIDQAALNEAVKAALADPAVAASIAKAVNDDAAARLKA